MSLAASLVDLTIASKSGFMEKDASSPRIGIGMDFLIAAVVAILSLFLFSLIGNFHYWDATNLSPYSGDYLVYLTWVQTLIEEGTCLHNSRVGQPLGTDWRGFPTADGWLNWQVIRLLILIKADPMWVMNWFYWLTYPMVGFSTYLAVRVLGLSRPTAFGVAILYNFVPYHYQRHGHVFMTAFYMVPWFFVACLAWQHHAAELGRRNWRTVGFFTLAIIGGTAYAYYAYFANILMLSAGIWRSVQDRSWRPVIVSTIWTAIVMVVLVLTLAPEIQYKRTAPFNPDVPKRFPIEAEIYASTMTQMVLPIHNHRISKFASIRNRYRDASFIDNENENVTLGIVGAAGLVALVMRFVFRRSGHASPNDLLNVLVMVILFLCIIGGFAFLINSALYTLGIDPWIRCYNRISVFLSFACVLWVGTVAEWLRSLMKSWQWVLLGLIVLTVGWLDETPRRGKVATPPALNKLTTDREFFSLIESEAAPQAMLYILGYRFYPECGIEPLTDYELFRPYLSTKQLRFNYGALRNEPNDVWYRSVDTLTTPALLTLLAKMEVHGVLICRLNHEDQGKQLENDIGIFLQQTPRVNAAEDFVFFSLTDYTQKLKREQTPEAWEQQKARLLSPIVPVCRQGFRPPPNPNTDPQKESLTRSFNRPAAIHLENKLSVDRQVEISFQLTDEHDENVTPDTTRLLKLEFGSQEEVVTIKGHTVQITRQYTIPPGEHVLQLTPTRNNQRFQLVLSDLNCKEPPTKPAK